MSKLSLILWLMLSPWIASGQDFNALAKDSTDSSKIVDTYNWKERIIYGGNVGAQFGSITFINVAPMLGYRVTERLTLGVRGTYNFIRINSIGLNYGHLFGGSGFGRVFLTESIFAHGEYQVLNGFFDGSGKRTNIPFLFVGGGYLYPLSDKVGLSVVALYELLNSRYSPYAFPIINMGIVARI